MGDSNHGFLAGIAKRLRQTAQQLEPEQPLLETRCPYVVYRIDWPDGREMPDSEMWEAYLHGKIDFEDWPGYSEHNAEHLQLAFRMKLPPKIYTFNPDEFEA